MLKLTSTVSNLNDLIIYLLSYNTMDKFQQLTQNSINFGLKFSH